MDFCSTYMLTDSETSFYRGTHPTFLVQDRDANQYVCSLCYADINPANWVRCPKDCSFEEASNPLLTKCSEDHVRYCSTSCRDEDWMRHRLLCHLPIISMHAQYNVEPQTASTHTILDGFELDRALIRARRLHLSGQFDAAMQLWEDTIIPSHKYHSKADMSIVLRTASHTALAALQFEKALQLSEQAVALDRSANNLYAYGLSLYEKGNYWLCIQVIYEALLLLKQQQMPIPDMFYSTIRGAEQLLHKGIHRINSPEYGSCLISTCRQQPGTVILTEAPMLVWTSTYDITQSSQEGDSLEHIIRSMCSEYEYSMCSIVPAFLRLPSVLRSMIRNEFFCPNIGNRSALVHQLLSLATNLCTNIPRLAGEFTVGSLVRLLLISKINAHAVPPSNTGLFYMSSKFTHSCTPNCLYDGERGQYVAVREILPGELLTFSYLGTNHMIYSSEVRQTFLRHTHIFLCKCPRCLDIDYGRGIPCVPPCRGIRFRRGTMYIPPGPDAGERLAPWQCSMCHAQFMDHSVPQLRTEDHLETRVMAFERTSKSLTNTGLSERFQVLKELVAEVVRQLGPSHWLYLKVCDLMLQYHTDVNQTKAHKKDTWLQEEGVLCAVTWGKKYLKAAHLQRLDVYCPSLVAEYQYRLFQVCGEYARVRREKVALAHACQRVFTRIFSWKQSEIEVVQATLASTSLLEIQSKPFYREYDVEEDEGGLLRSWEETITNFYVTNVLQKIPSDRDDLVHAIVQQHRLPTLQ